jgi:hypothetical protein
MSQLRAWRVDSYQMSQCDWAEVEGFVVNRVSDPEFHLCLHSAGPLETFLNRLRVLPRLSMRPDAGRAQFAGGAFAMAARPLPSTVTVNSELHRSQSQKYSTALFCTAALPPAATFRAGRGSVQIDKE